MELRKRARCQVAIVVELGDLEQNATMVYLKMSASSKKFRSKL